MNWRSTSTVEADNRSDGGIAVVHEMTPHSNAGNHTWERSRARGDWTTTKNPQGWNW